MADYEARSNGVECPECGDPRTPVKISGFGDTGKRYRRRRCYSCRTLFTTIEVALPEQVPWGALCTSAREAQRRKRRSANGWEPRPKRYGRTADVDVKLRVKMMAEHLPRSASEEDQDLVKKLIDGSIIDPLVTN